MIIINMLLQFGIFIDLDNVIDALDGKNGEHFAVVLSFEVSIAVPTHARKKKKKSAHKHTHTHDTCIHPPTQTNEHTLYERASGDVGAGCLG